MSPINSLKGNKLKCRTNMNKNELNDTESQLVDAAEDSDFNLENFVKLPNKDLKNKSLRCLSFDSIKEEEFVTKINEVNDLEKLKFMLTNFNSNLIQEKDVEQDNVLLNIKRQRLGDLTEVNSSTKNENNKTNNTNVGKRKSLFQVLK
jgi:hypothetical protein